MNKLFIALSLLFTSQAIAATPTLTVYTYSSFASDWGPGPAIKQAFENKCGCELKLVALDDGVSILNRLKLEGKRTKADLILGLDNNLLHAAKDTGLLAKHQQSLPELTMPGGWDDAYFVPYDYGYFAFIYNADKLEQPPQSFNELLERPELSLLYQDPRTSTPGQGLMLWVQKLYGDQAPQVWQNLAKRTVAVTKGWSESYGMFLKGEADLVLSYTSSPAYHIEAEQEHQYQAAAFSEGHYLQVEVAAKLNTSQQPELADQFMQFMLSPSFQEQIPTGNWMYPVIETPLPNSFADLVTPTQALSFSGEQVAKQRSGWLRQWLSAITR
ncbi:thiamine ABC transporter substrate binding subunit [Oceanisphaera pacifica]|uniref:Thiamine-binding periplasmic protein n=1 Tax=Oceanisphaera pacifica TaxID=2818389 RepID=A0ABS3NCG6_9GAMM|nr:thiamine ABC transporter substrate binding subunit [Oceanisphaera pacifica]MBO1518294.1 thiamine ABC transporter substrate binding subunit [Oceanisphaera pacifica]